MWYGVINWRDSAVVVTIWCPISYVITTVVVEFLLGVFIMTLVGQFFTILSFILLLWFLFTVAGVVGECGCR
jgi:hypothetical protein